MIEKYVDTDELRRLLSTLLVVLGALVVAGLFASIVVPGLRNANRPRVPMPVNPVVGEPGWLDPTEYPPEKGREIPPIDPDSLIAYTPELVLRGEAVFTANCITCHGELGHGDGPAAGTMNPKPRDFSNPDRWKNGDDLAAIFKTVGAGINGTSMSAFDYLSKRDRMAVAHYVRSLGTFAHAAGSAEAMESLAKELAAPGGRTQNRIPVSMAMSKLADKRGAHAIVVPDDDRSPGAELLRRVMSDAGRAARALSAGSAWRESPKILAATMVPAIPGNGFSAATATLTSSEWISLHEELLRVVPLDEWSHAQLDTGK